ncbi:TetR/AcrR family transcriptional regulator [Paraoerskovia marina]|uniref:TetR/AcrR family transcriptional regulator n=1 Tax=Paraoerskovia marina TaxID=545619 RepID=UPI000492D06B|nr:TetR/AcrR family transcriptional regulator [Paraoerskovia marina]
MARPKDADAARRISEAVRAVMARGGPQSLSVRAVAREAGCSTGLIMHTFADKRALLAHARALQHERAARRLAAIDEDMADAPAAARLRETLMAALPDDDERTQDARIWLGFLAAALDDDELRARHVAGNRSFVERVRGLVGEARPDDPRLDVAATTLALVSLVEGLTSLSTADTELYSPEARAAAVDRALTAHGLGSLPPR